MHYKRIRLNGYPGDPKPKKRFPRKPLSLIDEGYAWCSGCTHTLPITKFSKDRKRSTGLTYECKDCQVHRKLLLRYNLSIENYDLLFQRQGGVCAICHQPEVEQRLAVDHDHSCCPGEKSCGKCIRGLLCSRCNHVLGLVSDDAALVKEYSNYLMTWLPVQEIFL